ncbi:unnamed protein product [Closterium sp. NIES-65]|nr:unnamed protein product [Closterium sp. NIES-65]
MIMSTRVAVLTGAGVSAASGVPTFRGAGGLWRTYDATELATPQAFAADPSLVWEFYHYRRCCPPAANHHYSHFLPSHRNVDGRPCPAGAVTSSAACTTAITCALVLPARPCCTPRCALAACPPSPPTHRHPSPSPGKPQNVDGLHTAAGSSALVELHGCLWRTRCLTCGDISENRTQPICAALEGKGAPSEGAKAASIALKDLPRCTKLPGTSSGVCSGGAGGRGAGAEFNVEATALSPLATWKFPGDSAMLLPLVLG